MGKGCRNMADVVEEFEPQLLIAVASGKNAIEAGEAIGVSARTVNRRMQDPRFRLRVSQIRGEMVSAAIGSLTTAMDVAVNTLVIMAKEARSEVARLGAARAILEFSISVRRETEIEIRMRSIEDRLP